MFPTYIIIYESLKPCYKPMTDVCWGIVEVRFDSHRHGMRPYLRSKKPSTEHALLFLSSLTVRVLLDHICVFVIAVR